MSLKNLKSTKRCRNEETQSAMTNPRTHDYAPFFGARCQLCGRINKREMTKIWMMDCSQNYHAIPAHLACAYRRLLKEKKEAVELVRKEEREITAHYQQIVERNRTQEYHIRQLLFKIRDMRAANAMLMLSKPKE